MPLQLRYSSKSENFNLTECPQERTRAVGNGSTTSLRHLCSPPFSPVAQQADRCVGSPSSIQLSIGTGEMMKSGTLILSWALSDICRNGYAGYDVGVQPHILISSCGLFQRISREMHTELLSPTSPWHIVKSSLPKL